MLKIKQVANNINHQLMLQIEVAVASIAVAVQTMVVAEEAETLGAATTMSLGTTLVDRVASSRSVRSATSQIIPHLSAGIDMKKIFSPPTTKRMHHIQQPMVLTLIGMLIVELLTTSLVISRS
jgi:hypothetical protein